MDWGGRENTATERYSSIGGGLSNTTSVPYSTISGGRDNGITGYYGTIGGGLQNQASHFGSTIGGGYQNSTNATQTFTTPYYATIAGGVFNQAGGNSSAIGGGASNECTGNGATIAGGESNKAHVLAMVPGGLGNIAGGSLSFAAGRRAIVRTPVQAADTNGDEGTFIWADSTDEDFMSTGPNQFLIRASGGVSIGTNAPIFDLHVAGTAGKPGGGSWSVASDRRLKKNIKPITGALGKLLSLRGVTFSFKDPKKISELPGEQTSMIAQEVEKVFPDWIHEGGDGYKRLTYRGFEALTVEALRDLQTEKDLQIQALQEQNAELEARLAKLEALMATKTTTLNGGKR